MGFDRVFGIANGVVDALDQILPPGEEADEEREAPRARYARRAARPSPRSPRAQAAFAARVAAAMPARSTDTASEAPVTSTALAVRETPRRFRLVEATGEGGASVWVVTDGQESCVCSCKWLAERVMGCLAS